MRAWQLGEEITLKWGLFGSEPWTEGMRRRVQESLGLIATDNYGMSELGGPGFSGECAIVKDGMHIAEDLFIWEVLDPLTGEPVAGRARSVNWWSRRYGKRRCRSLRYRTRDLTSVTTQPCACGRTSARACRA